MENLNLDVITDNIFKLLDHSDISDLDFAGLLDISEKQLRLIKKKKAKFSIANINKACDVFDITISTINKNDIMVSDDFRQKLANKHKNNPEYYTFLEGRPTFRHVIRFTLLTNETFKSDGIGTGDIKELLASKGWNFTRDRKSVV